MSHEVDTPHGPARVHLHAADEPAGGLVLGHGAGGGVAAPDLLAARDVALSHGVSVALVEQPYRVAGRKSAAPAKQLDAAWLAVMSWLRDYALAALPLVAGGRSSGARVACRTVEEAGAVGVLCLAFPWIPPGKGPEGSREPELDAVGVPVLVVQGERDPFGMPVAAPGRSVVVVAGDHGLKKDLDGVRAAVSGWLPGVLGAQRTPTRSTTNTSVSSGPITPPAPRLP